MLIAAGACSALASAGPIQPVEAVQPPDEIAAVTDLGPLEPRPPRLHLPPALLKGMAAVMEVVGTLVPLPAAYTGEGLRSIAGVTYLGSNAKARRELGYHPRTSFDDGMYETMAWYKKDL